ncbi:MAG: ATP-binding cassette domain-containing protein [Thermoanaerobaculia bacterium]
MIEVKNLSKSFGKLDVLRDLSFKVEEGEVALILGRNGVGKTTLYNLMLGNLQKDGGEISISGLKPEKDYVKIKEIVGFMPEESYFYENWTLEENLNFIRKFFRNWDKEKEKELLEKFKLEKKQKLSNLNKGAKRKLSLLVSLCHNAKVFFFDEPLSGIDPIFREEILYSIIEEIQSKGGTFLISSHFLEELENIGTYLIFLKEGKIEIEGKIEYLREYFGLLEIEEGQKEPENLKILKEKRTGNKKIIYCQKITEGEIKFQQFLTLNEIFKILLKE